MYRLLQMLICEERTIVMDQYQPAPYGVYVYADIDGRITAINSDAFLTDLTGWTKIDEGYGDRHHHAQGNYLDGPLYDERSICRYNLANGAVVPRTQEEMDPDYVPHAPHVTLDTRVEAVEVTTDELILLMADMIGGAV